MFDPAPSSAGVTSQSMTSTVVGVVTGSSTWNRKSSSLGPHNPKRMYEEVRASFTSARKGYRK